MANRGHPGPVSGRSRSRRLQRIRRWGQRVGQGQDRHRGCRKYATLALLCVHGRLRSRRGIWRFNQQEGPLERGLASDRQVWKNWCWDQYPLQSGHRMRGSWIRLPVCYVCPCHRTSQRARPAVALAASPGRNIFHIVAAKASEAPQIAGRPACCRRSLCV